MHLSPHIIQSITIENSTKQCCYAWSHNQKQTSISIESNWLPRLIFMTRETFPWFSPMLQKKSRHWPVVVRLECMSPSILGSPWHKTSPTSDNGALVQNPPFFSMSIFIHEIYSQRITETRRSRRVTLLRLSYLIENRNCGLWRASIESTILWL